MRRVRTPDRREQWAQARFGTGTGGIVAMGIPMIAMFFCGGSSVTSNSRMLWSFSRDGALPGYKLWSSVNPWTKTPVNAVLFMVTLAFILGLPMLSSTIAFSAVVSISVIGLYISCEPFPGTRTPSVAFTTLASAGKGLMQCWMFPLMAACFSSSPDHYGSRNCRQRWP